MVRHILNLAASDWLDEQDLTWLASPPKIKLLAVTDARKPYPLSWDEQERLFRELPQHLVRMALFKVNTGTRDQEVCGLRWEWELNVPELGISVSIVPGDRVKNGEDRLIVLNRVAQSVVGEIRGEQDACEIELGRIAPGAALLQGHVFTYRGKPVGKMNNTAWKNARKRAGLEQVRVHDLKHTVRAPVAGCRSVVRGPAGSVGAQVRADYDALFGGGVAEPD